MQLVRKMLVSAAVVTAAVSGTLVLDATPARADVWDCHANADQAANFGEGTCDSGFGTYRVVVECNMAHWPYTRNINGPLVEKRQGSWGPVSRVDGQPNGCHVTKAWVVAY